MTPWRWVALNGIAALACVLAGPASSNGDNFFISKEIPGHPSYVIFGNVKDLQGKYISHATVIVYVARHMIEVSADTDVLGRFRSPDVGRVINEMGYEVDPSLITVSVDYPDYHIAHREYRGKYRQKKGAVEMDFRMQKNAAK
jgi:hypothetical protein